MRVMRATTIHAPYDMRVEDVVWSLNRINDYLVRWLVRKYKRFKRKRARAREALRQHARLFPGLFAHWKYVKP